MNKDQRIKNLAAGKILEEARKRRSTTTSQEEVARKIGCDVRYYNSFEAGLFPKNKQDIVRLADEFLGTDVCSMIYEQNVPTVSLKLLTTLKAQVEANIIQSAANRSQSDANLIGISRLEKLFAHIDDKNKPSSEDSKAGNPE
jgi:transcriptional regulator with XRE-family HTH domain